jgi:GSH-dependent disulfide-bond oxidoreductase
VFEALATAMTDVYAPFNGLFHIQDDFPGKVADEVIADFDARIRAALARLDAKLAKAEWVAGDFSIADIALYCNVWRLKTALNRSFPDLAHLQRWFAQIANRPGVQLAVSLEGRP